jgi:ABC-2 family transporter
MRWYILRTLLHKELLRHRANRGGILLGALLVVAAMLLSFAGKRPGSAAGLVGGVQHCYVDYGEDGPWLAHLHSHPPEGWQGRLQFRPLWAVPTVNGVLVYPPGTAAIQVFPNGTDERGPHYRVCFWHPGADAQALAPLEAWFWEESHRYFQAQAAAALDGLGTKARAAVSLPVIDAQRQSLHGGLDERAAVAAALVLFALFFVCVYLLPSLTCEERERGVLLAQALSPASPQEILGAKFLFYPILGVGLAALLSGIYSPAVLARPIYWLVLVVAACGSLGIGLTIASLARTQRTASMGALCYLLVVTLLLFICQQNQIPGLPYLFLEYHCPRVLHAALAEGTRGVSWGNLLGAAVLAVGWATLAGALFRRWGWQ